MTYQKPIDAPLWHSPNGLHTIIKRFNPNNGRDRLIVHCGGWTDWPIRYDDGRIVYDHPEYVPAYVKRQVARLMDEHIIGEEYQS